MKSVHRLSGKRGWGVAQVECLPLRGPGFEQQEPMLRFCLTPAGQNKCWLGWVTWSSHCLWERKPSQPLWKWDRRFSRNCC